LEKEREEQDKEHQAEVSQLAEKSSSLVIIEQVPLQLMLLRLKPSRQSLMCHILDHRTSKGFKMT
jgi:hypothetical protein